MARLLQKVEETTSFVIDLCRLTVPIALLEEWIVDQPTFASASNLGAVAPTVIRSQGEKF